MGMPKFELLKERVPFPPWGPEGDPPGPEIYSICDKLELDKLVGLYSLRMNYQREIQEAKIKFDQEIMQIQKRYQEKFIGLLG